MKKMKRLELKQTKGGEEEQEEDGPARISKAQEMQREVLHCDEG